MPAPTTSHTAGPRTNSGSTPGAGRSTCPFIHGPPARSPCARGAPARASRRPGRCAPPTGPARRRSRATRCSGGRGNASPSPPPGTRESAPSRADSTVRRRSSTSARQRVQARRCASRAGSWGSAGSAASASRSGSGCGRPGDGSRRGGTVASPTPIAGGPYPAVDHSSRYRAASRSRRRSAGGSGRRRTRAGARSEPAERACRARRPPRPRRRPGPARERGARCGVPGPVGHPQVADAGAEPVGDLPAGDADEPPRERAALEVEGVAAAPGADEDLLGDVLGIVVRAEGAQGDRVDRRGPAVVGVAQGRGVAGGEPPRQRVVGVRLARLRDRPRGRSLGRRGRPGSVGAPSVIDAILSSPWPLP